MVLKQNCQAFLHEQFILGSWIKVRSSFVLTDGTVSFLTRIDDDSSYFRADIEPEVRATIAHIIHHICGLTQALNGFNTAQMCLLPEERVRSPTIPDATGKDG